jgi:hypothetical protein
MEMVLEQRLTDPSAWLKTLICLLPMWLISLAVSVEGFPAPPIPGWAAGSAFVCGLLLLLVLLVRGWIWFDLVLYSLLPVVMVFIFDEILTGYKTPFIFTCTAVLSIGLIGYQYSQSFLLRIFFLTSGALLAYALADHAAASFWALWPLIDASQYAGCYMTGCYPFNIIPGHPWWTVLFR